MAALHLQLKPAALAFPAGAWPQFIRTEQDPMNDKLRLKAAQHGAGPDTPQEAAR
jgi:hypothetical protein